MTETVLVTGGAGAIGYWLSKKLSDDGKEVHVVDRFIHKNRDEYFENLIKKDNVTLLELDLCNIGDLEKIPFNYDVIYHLAAYNGTQNFYEKPFDVLANSTLPTINLLKWVSSQEKKPRFIYASSSEAYAGAVTHYNAKVPTPEDVHLVIDDPKNMRWSYGGSKLHGELAVFAASAQFDIPVTVMRFHNVYGVRMGLNHVIPDFISRAISGKYELHGYEDTRSFIYVEDAVDATIKVSKSPKFVNDIVNIGSEDEIKIIDLAKIILAILDINAEIKLFESPKGSVRRRCPDISKLKNEIGPISKIGLEEGLEKVINYMKKVR
jgi:UDP-glucose 4-epimerase